MGSMRDIKPQVDFNIHPRLVDDHPLCTQNQPMDKSVGGVIKRALARLQKSQSWLAEQAGVSDNAVSKWIKTGQISRERIPHVARILAVYPTELLGTDAERSVREDPATYNVEPGPDIAGRLPLVSWVQAGHWSQVIDNFAPGDAEEWLPCPVRHSASAFVLRVRGESMYNPHGRPSFHEGDLIFVDPEAPAVHGSLVVVRLDDDMEATFKRLVIEGNKRYLKALNPAWPEQMIEINGNATVCGVVIFKGERL